MTQEELHTDAPKPGTLGRRVYDGLVRMLADTDAYPPGTKLPPYRTLSRQYGVAYGIVSAAMKALESQGRVCIRNPHGVHVSGADYRPVPPKAVLIAMAVRARIADGTFQPDVPLVPMLAKEFQVARSTVTCALSPLIDEGLLVVRHGLGTYVQHPQTPGHGPRDRATSGAGTERLDGAYQPSGAGESARTCSATAADRYANIRPADAERLRARAAGQ
ncbi:GntR family transcriptional regulator [Streptomyces sp. NPDC092903]|uniref:GntR family transcriptional regulator n=1 Tax=Streptomyces sp. NPDC092903 TaxID=3366017 RepID=UPI003804D6F2